MWFPAWLRMDWKGQCSECPGTAQGMDWMGPFGVENSFWQISAGFGGLLAFESSVCPVGNAPSKSPGEPPWVSFLRFTERNFSDLQELAPVRQFTKSQQNVLRQMVADGIHSPWTSSVGRLFDAVASLMDLRQLITFEGQAAMEMEFALPETAADEIPSPLPADHCGTPGRS